MAGHHRQLRFVGQVFRYELPGGDEVGVIRHVDFGADEIRRHFAYHRPQGIAKRKRADSSRGQDRHQLLGLQRVLCYPDTTHELP